MISKRSNTTTGLDWNKMLGLLVQLKKAKRWKEYLLIGSGCYLGVRAKDLLDLKWIDVLNQKELVLVEHKTKKTRKITINETLQEIFKNVSSELIKNNCFNTNNYLFPNRKGDKISIQYINRLLKKTFSDYGVRTQNASTHTLRKTFGKRVWEMDGKSERSLIYLSQIFNHSNSTVTRRYIGIVQEDIRNIYLNL